MRKDGVPPSNSPCECKSGYKFNLFIQETAPVFNSIKYHWLLCAEFV